MKTEKQDFKAKIVTFREVFDLAHELAVQITQSSLSFDIIVGISRGGVTPARLLCDFLNIENLTSLQIRHYSKGARQMEEATIIDPVDVDIKDKNVLIADDVNDSGKTFEAAVEHIRSLGPGVVKTAVIHEKKTSSFNADFTGEVQEDWKWLVYEWAVTEDVLEFLKQDDMLDAEKQEALKYLKKNYELEMEPELLKKILQFRENYTE